MEARQRGACEQVFGAARLRSAKLRLFLALEHDVHRVRALDGLADGGLASQAGLSTVLVQAQLLCLEVEQHIHVADRA